MNDNPDVASFWKGRVLMQVEAVKTDKPLLRMEDIEGTEGENSDDSGEAAHNHKPDKEEEAKMEADQLERVHEQELLDTAMTFFKENEF